MNTVNEPSELCTRVVTDQAEIDRHRRFQVTRYFEAGLLDEVPVGLTDDPAVAASTYFGVYRGDQIQATARIVRATSRLPMLEHHQLYPWARQRIEAQQTEVAEISRLAVAATAPHYAALILLSREFLRFGMRHQHATVQIASVEKSMVKILTRVLDIPVHVIGPPIQKYGQYNGECVPILLDSIECLELFRQQASRRWEFFVDGLFIDLTAPAPVLEATPHHLISVAS